jgi:hypothetical protein
MYYNRYIKENKMKLNKVTPNDAKSILSNDRMFAKFLKENSNFLNKLVHKHVSNNRLNYKNGYKIY